MSHFDTELFVTFKQPARCRPGPRAAIRRHLQGKIRAGTQPPRPRDSRTTSGGPAVLTRSPSSRALTALRNTRHLLAFLGNGTTLWRSPGPQPVANTRGSETLGEL